MGRAALLLVLGVGAAFSIIGINIHKTGTQAIAEQAAYYRFASARNLARTSIHMTLRALDRADTSVYGGTYAGSFNSGSFVVAGSRRADTLILTTTARYEDTTYSMRLTLQRYPKPVPEANAALGIRAKDIDFKINGQALVDGRNYSADGSTLIGSGNKPGVSIMTADDSLDVMEDSTKLRGNPKSLVDTTTADPGQHIDEYRLNADYYYGPGDYNQSNITWGSQSNPVIVFCETADTTQTVRFSGNVTGWGILVVVGSLTATGNFKFYGLTIVHAAHIKVNVTASGNATFVGGLIMSGGTKSTFTINGQGNDPASIKYSSAALENAKYIGKLLAYRILDWYE
jgi:hypothetical protein